jgi:hypothetical protein
VYREYSKGLESGSVTESERRLESVSGTGTSSVQGWKQGLLKVLRKDKNKNLGQGQEKGFQARRTHRLTRYSDIGRDRLYCFILP